MHNYCLMLHIEKVTYTDVPVVKTRYRLRLGRMFFFFFLFVIIFSGLFVADSLNANAKIQASANASNNNTSLAAKINTVVESGRQLVDFVQNSKPQLKSNSGLTSILIVGVDSRNVAVKDNQFINTKPDGQAGTRNTDTIIQLVYNQQTNKFFMISIPRDMGVDVRKDCLDFHGSIHWVYDKSQKKNCPGGGMQTLQETVENITGIPVQYHVFITLEAFKDIITTLGETNEKGQVGLYINNPKSFYELYPINDRGWENVYFPAGRQFMTPERALEFVRSRQFTSDFGRAKRQQVFLEALKDRLLSTDIIFHPEKILSLLDTFRNKILFSEPESIGEVSAALDLVGKAANAKMTHIVLDPEFGGHEVYIDKQPHGRPGGPYYMVPKAWKECPGNEFCQVKEHILEIINTRGDIQEQNLQ